MYCVTKEEELDKRMGYYLLEMPYCGRSSSGVMFSVVVTNCNECGMNYPSGSSLGKRVSLPD